MSDAPVKRRAELEAAFARVFSGVVIRVHVTSTGYYFLDITIGERAFVVSFSPLDPRYGLLSLPDKKMSGADEVYHTYEDVVERVQYLIDHNEGTRPPP